MKSIKTKNAFTDLSKLMSPKSIAIIGASDNASKVGGRVVVNLQRSKFNGDLYLINPNYQSISGIQCYSSLNEVKDNIDVVMITVPAKFIPSLLNECEQKKVKFIMIFSAGFAEQGKEGKQLQKELKKFSNRTGIRIYGPNIPGLFNLKERLGMSLSPRFEPENFVPGKAALITQGGGMGRAILDSNDIGLGFNYWASTGNEADLDVSDFIYHFIKDEDVRVILVLIEAIKDGEKFKQVAEEANKKGIPLIILKIGTTAEGKAAVMSHTGALAGDDKVNSSILKQYSVIQVDDLDELVSLGWLFSEYATMQAKNIGILSFSGGANGMLLDKAALNGLKIGNFSEETVNKLENIFPPLVECKNPFDLTTYVLEKPELFEAALDIVCEDENIDALLIPLPYMLGFHTERMAEIITEKSAHSKKPIIPIWTSRTHHPERSLEILVESKKPFFRTFSNAAKVVAAFAQYNLDQTLFAPTTREKVQGNTGISSHLPNYYDRNILTEVESKNLFEKFGMDVVKENRTYSKEEAIETAKKVGYPVVLKVESKDVLHKTDAGGIRLGVQNDVEVGEAYTSILNNVHAYNPNAEVESIIVQEMADKGLELLLGLKRDPVFGLVAMLGTGGIFVEVFKDIAIRSLPLSEKDIQDMIDELKCAPLLKGVRGDKPKDIPALKSLLRQLSDFGVAYQDRISEVDINPVILYEEGKGYKVVDGLVIFEETSESKGAGY